MCSYVCMLEYVCTSVYINGACIYMYKPLSFEHGSPVTDILLMTEHQCSPTQHAPQ